MKVHAICALFLFVLTALSYAKPLSSSDLVTLLSSGVAPEQIRQSVRKKGWRRNWTRKRWEDCVKRERARN